MGVLTDNSDTFMSSSKPCFINAQLKRLMRTPELRIELAKSLDDLLQRLAYASRCPLGKLSLKVENGYLADHRYNQDKKVSVGTLSNV